VSTADELPRFKSRREEVTGVCFQDGRYPFEWPRHDSCPACGGQALRPAFCKHAFNHDRCEACGFVCLNPFPPDDILRALYEGQYYTAVRECYELPNAIEGKEDPSLSVPREILQAVVKRAAEGRSSGAWLDVGGGLGAFADQIARHLPRWSVELNELNPVSAEIARRLFGLSIVSHSPKELSNTDKRYDVVSSIGVLEHLPNPAYFLSSYARLLKPGGMMIVVIPQFTPLNSFVSRASSPNIVPPFHASLFNKENLRLFLNRLGIFEKAEIFQAGGPAFSLVEHVAFGDKWDVLIPTPHYPRPTGVQVVSYTDSEEKAIAVLGRANTSLRDFFAETDGRELLIAYLQLNSSVPKLCPQIADNAGNLAERRILIIAQAMRDNAADLRRSLAQSAEVAVLKQRLAELGSESAGQITGREQRIRELEAELTSGEQRIRELEAELTGGEQRIGELEAELTGGEQRIRELEAEAAANPWQKILSRSYLATLRARRSHRP
jgi:ubiquinone/menaquinone biosynthesis C-methylase UbiE